MLKPELFQSNKETYLFLIYLQETKTEFSDSDTTNALKNSHI